ncbi:MAG: hypothetical protein HKN08_00770 [Gammaproteobacteria bacterium]|nr:hypothetical protein [Gammaproteobacteria bacterium]
MKHKTFGFKVFSLTIWLCTLLVFTAVKAQDTDQLDSATGESADVLNLVQNTDSQSIVPPPPSGTIILPDSLVNNPDEEKKCMTVCARWGEDCTYINRGAGGMTRSCRRTCQQFTEECF